MYKIRLENISRKYIIGKNKEFYAIKNISLVFDSVGITSIIGKSGSGKSTIINMIAGIDKPSEGSVFIDDIDIAKLNQNKLCKFYKSKIGILFQNYNLLEDETAIFNVSISLMINGAKKTYAENRAKILLERVGLDEKLFNKKVSLLSGGEKQRVALARTLINEPEIILCDEPTGALDSKNSSHVMNVLKEYSKDHLIILVSHNLQLVNRYSDRIIKIAGGIIKGDRRKKELEENAKNSKLNNKKSSNWIDHLSISNFKKRFKRNVFSLLALSISLISTFLTIGFINGKDDSINNASIKQFDFASGTISKEEEISKGSLLTLTRSVRPSVEEINNNKFLTHYFNITPNFDVLLPINLTIEYDEMVLENIYYYPIYSFEDKSVNKDLLMKGSIPKHDSLNEVVINDKCYSELCNKLKKDVLYEYLDVSSYLEYSFVDFDETTIIDEFIYNRSIKIVGVVKELNYLQNSKIYYSYSAFEMHLHDYILPNLSTYFNEDITWYDRIVNAENFDPITSYSCHVFLIDYEKSNILFNDINLENNLSYSSPSLLVRTSLLGFLQVAEYGLLIFLIVTIIGSVLIIGIMSFTSYSEDHKISAILSCMGASESEICTIYLNESFFNGLTSIIISLFASFGLSIAINKLIQNFVDLINIINIPFFTFLNIPFLFPFLSIIIGLIICFLVTSIPIVFSKKISLKEELQSI